MKTKKNENTEINQENTINVETLETELKRVNHNERFRKLLRSTVYTLIVVAACAVLVAVLFMPVLRIYGSSMNPTLNEGEIVVSIKGSSFQSGDVVGVYFGSKLLVKRVIATAGQWVDIDEDGTVYVYDNVKGKPLEEPYLSKGSKAFGETNISLPCQVPPDSIFVMGDNRSTSVDSRNTSVGCIDIDNVVGKIVFKIWPLKDFGLVNKSNISIEEEN